MPKNYSTISRTTSILQCEVTVAEIDKSVVKKYVCEIPYLTMRKTAIVKQIKEVLPEKYKYVECNKIEKIRVNYKMPLIEFMARAKKIIID